MLDTEWAQYKAIMRHKYRKKPKDLANLEGAILMFENASGKLNFHALTQFAKDRGRRMSKEDKEKIVNDAQAEAQKVRKDGPIQA
jgi:hypothetical protein